MVDRAHDDIGHARGSTSPGGPNRSGPQRDAIVRTFLFADLRGYTAFVERAGDAAAAELLDRYRALVRGVVAAHAGAEIRTEGDSFYVVFPSPSSAVRAALAILTSAEADAVDHAESPISMGIGIHAGEAAEVAEGYVGSAVNTAARICAAAGPGELLVSATVRSLVRTSLPLRFTARGRRTFKGLAEPVELYAVSTADAVGDSMTRPRPVRALAIISTIAGAGAIVLFGAAWLGGVFQTSGSTGPLDQATGSPSTSPSAIAYSSPAIQASPASLNLGPLAAGTYRTDAFKPTLLLTLQDGWSGLRNSPQELKLAPMGDVPDNWYDNGGQRLYFLRPQVVYLDCQMTRDPDATEDSRPRPSTQPLEAGRGGLIDWLQSTDTVALGPGSSKTLGSFSAIVYDVTLSGACDAGGTVTYDLFPVDEIGDQRINFPIRPGERQRWALIEVEGEAFIAVISAPETEFEDFSRFALPVLVSLSTAD